jgi:hypothetical protein
MKSKINLLRDSKKIMSGCSDNKIQIALWVILGVFIIIIIIFAFFYPNRFSKIRDPVVEKMTGGNNYDSESVLNTTIPTIVFFHSSKCDVCDTTLPDYVMLRDTYKNNPKYRVAIINCDKNKEFCSKENIHKFPTIRHYTNPTENKYKTIFETNN